MSDDDAEYARTMAILQEESPRGRVLVACSLIEDVLARVLLARFLKGATARDLVEAHGAPLASFAARARTAYVLGLISKAELQDVLALGDLRNVFAHQVEAGYDHPEVRALAARLHRAAGLEPGDRRDPEQVVDLACARLVERLLPRPGQVRRVRPPREPGRD